jgi:sulfur-oxidizing protein SoxY
MTTRRQFLIITGGLVAASGISLPAAAQAPRATPEAMKAAIRELIGEAPVKEGRVKLDLPPIVENGNSVSMTVAVDSPMTEADHVKGIHVFTEKNPQPYVGHFHLGPRSGRASIATRIRLADSQKIIAIAQLSDGSFWSDTVEVIVTIAACLEGI